MLSWQDRMALWFQSSLTWLFSLVLYYPALLWLKLYRGYKIPEIRRIRREYQELLEKNPGPVLICANHLTMIDSLLLIWILVSGWKYFLKPSLFPWNLPEKKIFYGNPFLSLGCFLGKCIPVVRQGPRDEMKRVLAKVKYLLDHGQSIMVFPEGQRSRIARVDTTDYAYGVGTILQQAPHARVLCIYLRGRAQAEYSNIPKRGDEFYFDMRMIQPETSAVGLRGARDIATTIIHDLAEMEQIYFGQTTVTGR